MLPPFSLSMFTCRRRDGDKEGMGIERCNEGGAMRRCNEGGAMRRCNEGGAMRDREMQCREVQGDTGRCREMQCPPANITSMPIPSAPNAYIGTVQRIYITSMPIPSAPNAYIQYSTTDI
jgi:hypothetical protein